MKISIFSLENVLNFDESNIQVLEIERPSLFRSVVYSFNQLQNGEVGTEQIVLEDKDEILEIPKHTMMIFDVFNFDFNRSLILKNLYGLIEQDIIMDEDLKSQIQDIALRLNALVAETTLEYNFSLAYKNVISISEMLKLIRLKFNINEYTDPTDNIHAIMEIVSSLKICKILVLVNCKCYFDEVEIQELYKSAIYKKINLLLLEPNHNPRIIKYEKKLYIDGNYDEYIL